INFYYNLQTQNYVISSYRVQNSRGRFTCKFLTNIFHNNQRLPLQELMSHFSQLKLSYSHSL
ncbi:unnamed protein product, partial [Heterotrigona itama]